MLLVIEIGTWGSLCWLLVVLLSKSGSALFVMQFIYSEERERGRDLEFSSKTYRKLTENGNKNKNVNICRNGSDESWLSNDNSE